MPLDYLDREILRLLFRARAWMNTNQVADEIGIAWLTADRHLKKLNKIGYVVRGKGSKTIFWRINQ